MFPSEELVRPILAAHEPRLAGIYERAWAKVTAMPERASFDLKRTVATVMHQMTMNELRAEYHGERGVHLMEEHETIRLKKMDERGYTRAAPTQATLAFTTPETPLPFSQEDFPDLCSVDVGYVLNELGTRLEDILVAARDRDAVLWSYAIDRGAPATATATLIPAPLAPTSPASIIRVPGAEADRKRKRD
jgi:hypothetical protein